MIALFGLVGRGQDVPEPHEERSYPSGAQVTRYLEGRRIEVGDNPAGAKPPKHGLRIPAGGIKALEVETGGLLSTANGNGPPKGSYVSKVILIVQSGGKRYVVEGDLWHRRVATDRAFYGFQVRSITAQ